MPIYDYKCLKCGEKKEFMLPMNHEAPLHKELHTDGLDCNQNLKLKRVYSVIPVIFNGDGWTNTPQMKKKKAVKDQAIKDINGGEFLG